MKNKRASFYIREPLAHALSATDGGRGLDLTDRLNTIAERYLALVAKSTPVLAEAEWFAIVASLAGFSLNMESVRHLQFRIEDAHDLGQDHGIDPAALAAEISEMSLLERIAIMEVVERIRSDTSSIDPVQVLLAAGAKLRGEERELGLKRPVLGGTSCAVGGP